MGNYIELKKLNLDELIGVVNLYPWFGGARKELCVRMCKMGEGWSDMQYADTAMYVVAREKIMELKRSSEARNLTDADVETLLRSYISESSKMPESGSDSEKSGTVHQQETRVYAVGGDYFSQEAYDHVKRTEDNVFLRYAAKAKKEASPVADKAAHDVMFYTETLAQIYAEQGYYDQAKDIYSKLLLAYPEKNAYFAALIQKLDQINS